jgi:hypothetical protein
LIKFKDPVYFGDFHTLFGILLKISIMNDITHIHDHAFCYEWSLACCGKTIVSVQIHYILFSLRQTKHRQQLHFSIFFARLFPSWIYLLKHCLLIQVRRVTMATYQVISHNEKRSGVVITTNGTLQCYNLSSCVNNTCQAKLR